MNVNLGNEGIICPNCGISNKQGYRFCVKCGTKLTVPAPKPEPAEPAPFGAFEQTAPAVKEEPVSPAPFSPFEQPSPASLSAFEQSAPAVSEKPAEPEKKEGFARLGQAAFAPQTPKETGFARSKEGAFAPEDPKKEPAAGFARSVYSGAVTPTAAAGAFAAAVDAVRNDKKIDISDAETVMSLLEQGEQSALAKGLPDWDVLPPQIVVRRKHRV